jgi:hypothetical protein
MQPVPSKAKGHLRSMGRGMIILATASPSTLTFLRSQLALRIHSMCQYSEAAARGAGFVSPLSQVQKRMRSPLLKQAPRNGSSVRVLLIRSNSSRLSARPRRQVPPRRGIAPWEKALWGGAFRKADHPQRKTASFFLSKSNMPNWIRLNNRRDSSSSIR